MSPAPRPHTAILAVASVVWSVVVISGELVFLGGQWMADRMKDRQTADFDEAWARIDAINKRRNMS